MKKQSIKRLLRFSFVLFIGLSLTLAIHLYLIKQAKANQKVFAMGRIDFNEPTPKEDLSDIRDYTASLSGISNAIYNSQERVLVFMYEPKQIDANKVLSMVKQHAHTEATRYISTSENLKSGCPVNINQSSFIGKALAFISPN